MTSKYISLRHELVTLMDDGLTTDDIAAIMNMPLSKIKEMIEIEESWMVDDLDSCF